MSAVITNKLHGLKAEKVISGPQTCHQGWARGLALESTTFNHGRGEQVSGEKKVTLAHKVSASNMSLPLTYH